MFEGDNNNRQDLIDYIRTFDNYDDDPLEFWELYRLQRLVEFLIND